MRGAVLALALLTSPAMADPVEVDVELFLAVDVSRSMAPAELEIQRRGYAEALASNEVLAAIGSGMIGRIAVTYVEWAGNHSQNVVIPWTLLETPAQAKAIADTLTFEYVNTLRRTSISGAIDYARESFGQNDFQGLRRIIDISGDGPNNQGGPVTRARDRAVATGIIINGLPLMTREGANFLGWHLEDLDRYYLACVIGGPGSFVIPVTDWAQFAGAVRRKLVLELAGGVPRVIRAQSSGARPDGSYDCLIGEKLWERRRRIFDEP